MPAEHITTRVDGHVLHIGVARPEQRNSFDRGMRGSLQQIMTSADAMEGLQSFIQRRTGRFSGR